MTKAEQSVAGNGNRDAGLAMRVGCFKARWAKSSRGVWSS